MSTYSNLDSLIELFKSNLNEHAKGCVHFDGYKFLGSNLSTSYGLVTEIPQFPRDDCYWDIRVSCKCGTQFPLAGQGEHSRAHNRVEDYCESSKMFSKSIREEAIASQKFTERMFYVQF